MIKLLIGHCLSFNWCSMFVDFCSHLNFGLSSIVVGLQDMVKEVIVHWIIRNTTQSTLNFIQVFVIFLALWQVGPVWVNKLV